MECHSLREGISETRKDRGFFGRIFDATRFSTAILRSIGTSILKHESEWQAVKRISNVVYGNHNALPTKSGFSREMENIGYCDLVPKTYVVPNDSTVSVENVTAWMSENKIGFPLFAKPDEGGMSSGIRLIESADELQNFLRWQTRTYVLQEHQPPSEKEVRYIAFEVRGVIYRVCYEKRRPENSTPKNPYRWSIDDDVRGVGTDDETYQKLDPLIADIITKLQQKQFGNGRKRRTTWCFDVGIGDRDERQEPLAFYEIQDVFSPAIYLLPRLREGGFAEGRFMLRQIIQQTIAS